VASARSVTVNYYDPIILDLFVATAWRYAIFEGEEGLGVVEDALRVIMLKDNLYFAAFQGSAYRSITNFTDFAAAAVAFFRTVRGFGRVQRNQRHPRLSAWVIR